MSAPTPLFRRLLLELGALPPLVLVLPYCEDYRLAQALDPVTHRRIYAMTECLFRRLDDALWTTRGVRIHERAEVEMRWEKPGEPIRVEFPDMPAVELVPYRVDIDYATAPKPSPAAAASTVRKPCAGCGKKEG